MATIDLELVASAIAVVTSIGAASVSLAKRDLSNYKELDQTRDRLRSQAAALSNRLNLLEQTVENTAKIHKLEQRDLNERCNRHRREIENIKKYLSKKLDFAPRDTDPGDSQIF